MSAEQEVSSEQINTEEGNPIKSVSIQMDRWQKPFKQDLLERYAAMRAHLIHHMTSIAMLRPWFWRCMGDEQLCCSGLNRWNKSKGV